MELHERAWRYATGIDSIQGQGGSNACFAAALALGRGFNLSRPDAWAMLLKWNASNARPPWREAELKHKLDDAIENGAKPFGFLLQDTPRPCERLTPRPTPPRTSGPSDDEKAAAERERWPMMRALTPEERDALATFRNVPREAVAILESAGLLYAGQYQGRPCYFLREVTFCQARALDGKPLRTGDGPAKSVNLKGSRGAFFGAALLGAEGRTGDAPPVLLVEGCVGLLEAVAAAFITGADARGWTCLAAISAGSRFNRTPELLARLKGRRVRIIPDAGAAGMAAAEIWASELDAVGAEVDGLELPEGAKDLGDLLANTETNPHQLTEIFEL